MSVPLEKRVDLGESAAVTRLSMKLASGSEDSTCEVVAYDPLFTKYLDAASRVSLPIKLAGRTFTFEGAVDNYDFASMEVTLTGNSPAWQFNLTPRYRVFQQKTTRQVLSKLGASVESVGSSQLDQTLDLVQNYCTDYQFLVRVCAGLGLRVSGDLGGGGVKVTADKGEQVLTVTGKFGQQYSELATSNNDIAVTGLSIRHADVQESAKSEPASAPEVATDDSEEQTEVSEKFIRIDPRTGAKIIDKNAETPSSDAAKAKAKARAIEMTLALVATSDVEWLGQPGDSIALSLTDAGGQQVELSLLIESANYEFYPEHYEIQLELKTAEASADKGD